MEALHLVLSLDMHLDGPHYHLYKTFCLTISFRPDRRHAMMSENKLLCKPRELVGVERWSVITLQLSWIKLCKDCKAGITESPFVVDTASTTGKHEYLSISISRYFQFGNGLPKSMARFFQGP